MTEKTCSTCIHHEFSLYTKPCSDCVLHKRWILFDPVITYSQWDPKIGTPTVDKTRNNTHTTREN